MASADGEPGDPLLAEPKNKKQKQECKCEFHETWKTFTNDNTVVHIERGKYANSGVAELLRSHNFLNRAEYICKSCISMGNFIKSGGGTSSSSNTSTNQHIRDNRLSSSVKSLIISLQDHETNLSHVIDRDWSKLLRLIGERVLFDRLNKTGTILSQIYKDENKLSKLDPDIEIFNHDPLFLSLLEGMSKRDFMFVEKQAKFHYLCIMESALSLVNFNWVLPFNFVSSLIQSFVSGSKVVTTLNGKLSPCGGYTTYLEWLKNLGSEVLKCPKGDIITFIDNIGRYIIKNYRVTKDKTSQADVITTCLHIVLEANQALQSRHDLKPCFWGASLTLEDKQLAMENKIDSSKVLFRRCRYNYLAHMIDIFQNQTDTTNKRIDFLIKLQQRHCTNPVSISKLLDKI